MFTNFEIMGSNSKVHFFFKKKGFSLKNRSVLKKFIESIFRRERKKLASLNYIFCSDKDLLNINRQFLNHDFYTDIITFDLSVSDKVDAEVYISVDRVRENAEKMKVSFKSELHRVLFHGVLHLCSYNDKTKRDKAEMTSKEDFYLKQYQ